MRSRRCTTPDAASTSASPTAREIEDWDLPFAYEALARAHAVAGDAEEADRLRLLAEAAAEKVEDANDRALVLADLATLTVSRASAPRRSR